MVYTNETMMTHIAKLFKNGRSQAVRLPMEFKFDGSEVYIRRDEKTGEVILSQKPAKHGNWDEYFKFRDKVYAEAPEEFEEFISFIESREKRPPKDRKLFE